MYLPCCITSKLYLDDLYLFGPGCFCLICDKIEYMEITKTHKIIISILAVILLLGAYVVFDKRSKISQDEEDVVDISEEVATTTPNSGTQTVTNSDGTTFTIEKITPPASKVVPKPIPDLNRVVINSPLANVSEGDLAMATQKIKELQSILKGNPTIFTAWLDLASYQKMAGDFDGAIISWKYAGKLTPTDFVSIANIGNLYAYSLKDHLQAEVYYKQAISKAPKLPYLYTQLAEVYKYFFNDLNKAIAIIDEGLKKIPNDPGLLEFKKSLQ